MNWQEKVQRILAERGISQLALASMINRPHRSVNHWLGAAGRQPHNLPGVLAKIATALDVDASWLADDSAGWPPLPPDRRRAELELAAPQGTGRLLEAIADQHERELLLRFLEILDADRDASTARSTQEGRGNG